jgi:outer membrane protein assembly factor BamB
VTNRTRALLATVGAVCVVASCASKSAQSGAPSKSSVATTSSTTVAGSPTSSGTRGGGRWTTYLQDAGRTGFTSDAPTRPQTIRRAWQSPALDGAVYAEPLLVGDRVIVATENDSVYALRATTGAIVWRTHLGTPVSGSSLPCGNVDPVGITSTPVIDAVAGRVYAVGMVWPARDVLFDINLASGKLVASKAVDIAGADPKVHNQRSALTLSAGKVSIPYGGRFGDCGDYHGRVASVAVSASGLGALTSYTLPTQGEGGFWTPPGAAVATDGSLYLASGNSSSTTTYDYGNSVVRLSAGLKLLDSWAPRNWKALNATDGDIGSSGPVLLPGGRVFQIGKSGIGYLLDAGHLGGIGGELHSGEVCSDSGVWGAIGHHGDTLFVPCSGGVVEVTVHSDGFTVGWSTDVSTPGPTIVTPAAVWTVETGNGRLLALDPATGKILVSLAIGSVPSRFTTPAAGGRRVLVASDQRISAFGP